MLIINSEGMTSLKILGVKMHGRTNDLSDFVEFNLLDVNYIDLWSPTEHSAKVPAYHTSYGSFIALSTIKDISTGYKKFGFTSFDRSTVINNKNIKHMIVENNGTKVVFNDDSYVRVRKKIKE